MIKLFSVKASHRSSWKLTCTGKVPPKVHQQLTEALRQQEKQKKDAAAINNPKQSAGELRMQKGA